MSTPWPYLIPTLNGSPWGSQQRTRTSQDPDYPNVGIYCAHEDSEPWLLGSFLLSSAVLEDRGEVLWVWRRKYVTGDGYVINLAVGSGIGGPDSIVDDRPHNREALTDELRRAIQDHGPGSPEVRELSALIDHADATMRSRVSLKCHRCGLSRTYRSENVQEIVGGLWSLGIREVDLATFARRVDRRPRVN